MGPSGEEVVQVALEIRFGERKRACGRANGNSQRRAPNSSPQGETGEA